MENSEQVWMIFNAETKLQTKPLSLVQAQRFVISLNPTEYHKFFLWTPGWVDWISIRDYIKSDQTYFKVIIPPNPLNIQIRETETNIEPTKTNHTVTQTRSNLDPAYTEIVVGPDLQRSKSGSDFYSADFNGDDLNMEDLLYKKSSSPTVLKKNFPTPHRSPSAKEADDRRVDDRHNFKIEVVLVSKLRSFRTYSRNISLRGTLLEDEVPKDFLNQNFDLIIVNPFERDPRAARLLFKAKIVGDLVDPRRLSFFEQEPRMTESLEALLTAYMVYQRQKKSEAS